MGVLAPRAKSWHRQLLYGFSIFSWGLQLNLTKILHTNKNNSFFSIQLSHFFNKKLWKNFSEVRKSLKVLLKDFFLGSLLNSHPGAARRLLHVAPLLFPSSSLLADIIYVRRTTRSDSLGGAFEKKFGAYITLS